MREEPQLIDRSTRALFKAALIAVLTLSVALLVGMAVQVLDRVHTTLVQIVFAILLAYAVYPPVRSLARRGLPITLAVIVVYVVLALLVVGALVWLAPAIVSEVEAITHDYPVLLHQAQRQIADPTHSPLLARFPAGVRDEIAANTGKLGALAGALAAGLGSHVLGIVSGTTTVLVSLALILGLTLVFLSDLPSLRAFGLRVVPPRYRSGAIAFMSDVDTVIGGFVRGQIVLALLVGVCGTVVLLALGVPYGLLLGILAGALSIVPIVGPIAAILPVLAIAAFTVGVGKTIVVLVLFALIIGVQQGLLVPRFVARSVGVTPLVIFVALLLGSEAFGILGALLAIPIAGILRVTADRLFPPDGAAQAELARRRIAMR